MLTSKLISSCLMVMSLMTASVYASNDTLKNSFVEDNDSILNYPCDADLENIKSNINCNNNMLNTELQNKTQKRRRSICTDLIARTETGHKRLKSIIENSGRRESYLRCNETEVFDNTIQEINDLFEKYPQPIVSIIMQSDGAQEEVIRAQLQAVNKYFPLKNLGKGTPIVCEASGALPGTVLAISLLKGQDPIKNFDAMQEKMNRIHDAGDKPDKSSSCTGSIKAWFLESFIQCIDFCVETEREKINIIDSAYTPLSEELISSIIPEEYKIISDIELPNLQIRHGGITHNLFRKVINSIKTQDAKSCDNTTKLVLEHVFSLLESIPGGGIASSLLGKYNNKYEELNKIDSSSNLGCQDNKHLNILFSFDVNNINDSLDFSSCTVTTDEKDRLIKIAILTDLGVHQDDKISYDERIEEITNLLGNNRSFLHVVNRISKSNIPQLNLHDTSHIQ